MALNAAGTLVNLYYSLDLHLDALEGLGYPVHRHGMRRFVPPATGAWVRARFDLLPLERRFYRQVSNTEVGDELRGMLDLIVAEHARTFTQRYTLAAARDTVVALFPPSGTLPIRESGGDEHPQVGTLYLDTLGERLLDDGARSGLVQHSISVSVRYLAAYSTPD